MVIETMLAAIYVLLQPLLPPLLLPPTKPPTPKEHHIRVAFKGGRVIRAGPGPASQKLMNKNTAAIEKTKKSCIQGRPGLPDRAGASQPETNENHQSHRKTI